MNEEGALKYLVYWELNGGGSGQGDIQEQTTFFKFKKCSLNDIKK